MKSKNIIILIFIIIFILIVIRVVIGLAVYYRNDIYAIINTNANTDTSTSAQTTSAPTTASTTPAQTIPTTASTTPAQTTPTTASTTPAQITPTTASTTPAQTTPAPTTASTTPAQTTPASTTPASTTTAPTTPAPTTPAPTTPAPTTTAPTTPAPTTTATPIPFTLKNEPYTTVWNSATPHTHFLDRHNVDCGNNSLNKVVLKRNGNGSMRYEYSCSQNPNYINRTSHSTPFNDDGGGIPFYLDRHDINCDKNPLSQFALVVNDNRNQIKYDYKCMVPTNTRPLTCRDEGSAPGPGDYLDYLDRHELKCNKDEVISSIKLERMSQAESRYRWKCCKPANPNDPISTPPTST